MAERKFTLGLNKPGMAAQLRETVSQVVRESAVLVSATARSIISILFFCLFNFSFCSVVLFCLLCFCCCPHLFVYYRYVY